MKSNGCQLLDTGAFDAVSDVRGKLIKDFDKIQSDYNDIINALLQNWEGRGADAFREDATKVKSNIGGISDILKMMCDTLADCRAVIAESDKGMGDYNMNPFSQ